MPTRGGLVSISPRQSPQVLRLSLRLPSTSVAVRSIW